MEPVCAFCKRDLMDTPPDEWIMHPGSVHCSIRACIDRCEECQDDFSAITTVAEGII
jgi:hypothetical protein